MKLFIEGRRNGYGTDQCGKTMTVGELIAFLEWYDEDTKVYLKNDNGFLKKEVPPATMMSCSWLKKRGGSAG